MVPMTLDEIAEAVGGVLYGVPDPRAVVDRAAVIDSRHAGPGCLFVALPGERTDGHRFAAAAVAAGAVAVLAARPVGVPAVVVPDPLDALARLARAVMTRLDSPTVVALTGSAGKTGTKDLLSQLMERAGATVATPLSYNNRIGLPLTVLRADAGTRCLLLEMGASRAGHITYLTGIVPPTVGLVLNVGTAHLGEFGGKDGIAAAKGELVEALPPDGLAVLNADDPYVMAMSARTTARVLTFGRTAGDVRATRVELDRGGRPSFTLTHDGSSAPVRLGMYGEHHVANATAAAAVALSLGAALDEVAETLHSARQLTRGRMEVVERPDGVTVVNDAFNANPDSMDAALNALAAMSAAGRRRTIAVLGEMRELGDESAAYHAELGRRVAAAGVGVLVAVGGPEAALVHDQAQAHGVAATLVPDRDAALEFLARCLEPGDLVLVKGSHSAGLEETATRLATPDAVVMTT